MKLLRLLIVALLAVVLPLRGAMAAISTCEDLVSHGGQTSQVDEVQTRSSPAPDSVHHHDGSHHHHTGSHTHDGAKHLVKCTSPCSLLSPLGAGVPGIMLASAVVTIKFPVFAAPLPSFISGGQERPPRALL